MDNPYRVGSLTWIERNRYNTVRHLLDRLLSAYESGPATLNSELANVREEVWTFDTDSATA